VLRQANDLLNFVSFQGCEAKKIIQCSMAVYLSTKLVLSEVEVLKETASTQSTQEQ
jgi:hypothetical protein